MSAPTHDYPSTAISVTHPARLVAAGMLHGVGNWPGSGFRYIELGCGNGTNLLALASQFRDATFVGVDRDASLIARAKEAAEGCELHNVTFHAAPLLKFEPPSELFDFVVAHGIYSWVDPETASRIFELASRMSTPSGVSMVSYNTLPGWAVRGVVRDVMRSATQPGQNDTERLRSARSRVAQLHRMVEPLRDSFAILFRSELASVADKPDGYILGEHLAERNQPLYVGEVLRRAAMHNLTMVAELMPASAEGALEEELRASMRAAPREEIEQTIDLVCFRQFRATVFCKSDVSVAPEADYRQLLAGGVLVGKLAPLAEEPLLGPGKVLRFKTQTGAEIEAKEPLLKAALLALASAWPDGLTAQAVISDALGLLQERGITVGTDHGAIETTVGDLILLARRRLIEILPFVMPRYRELDSQPFVTPVTRLEARSGGVVTNIAHEPVLLREPTRTLTTLLDGTRDLRALIAALGERVDSGELMLSQAVLTSERVRVFAELIAASLNELRGHGLLVPRP